MRINHFVSSFAKLFFFLFNLIFCFSSKLSLAYLFFSVPPFFLLLTFVIFLIPYTIWYDWEVHALTCMDLTWNAQSTLFLLLFNYTTQHNTTKQHEHEYSDPPSSLFIQHFPCWLAALPFFPSTSFIPSNNHYKAFIYIYIYTQSHNQTHTHTVHLPLQYHIKSCILIINLLIAICWIEGPK